jgi:hypothetical protein
MEGTAELGISISPTRGIVPDAPAANRNGSRKVPQQPVDNGRQ